MKIQHAQVQLAADHAATRQRRLEVRPTVTLPPPSAPPPQVTLSAESLAAQRIDNSPLNLREELEKNPLWGLIRELIQSLTGRDIDLDSLVPSQHNQARPDAAAPPAVSQPAAPSGPPSYQRIETTHETEHTRFAATGHITTTDGQQISFTTQLDLHREFRQLSISREAAPPAAQRKDPLILNYAAASASLRPDKITFDLDADGQNEHIALAGAGSGFLALDRNQDGRINDGNELFGALSGNGFEELSRLDEDHNGWIDENDAVWASLQLWLAGEDGQTQLVDLAALGIGALYLGSAVTDFSLNNARNIQQGQLRRSGLYVSETGQVGTLQQVDLVV